MAVSVHGLPPLLRSGLRVAAVPPELRQDRWHVVEEVTGDERGQLVSFRDVHDIDAAQGLVGKTLLASIDDLPEDLSRYDVDTLIGREVIDCTNGSLGHIDEIMRGPANDVWCVVGPSGETLVPVVDEFLVALPDEGPIMVSLPDGL